MKTKINLIIAILAFMSIQMFAQNRIIGGSNVDISQRPYQAFIKLTNGNATGRGGGVIINEYWVLTAAHVALGTSISNIKVITGLTDISGNNSSEEIAITERYIHPNYNGNVDNPYDIALLKLSTPITFNANRQPAKISSTYTIPYHTLATVSGWGKTGTYDSSTSILQKADIYVQSSANQPYQIYSNIINNITPYNGDSGGPLTRKINNEDILIGINQSIEIENGLLTHSLFTNVGYFKNWIYNTIYNNAISGPRLICGDDEFTINSYGANLELSSNLRIISQNGNRYQIGARYNGAGSISLRKDGDIVCSLPVYCGTPIVTDITVVDRYYYAVLAPGNVFRTSAYWEIDQYRITNNDVYCPIQPLGQYSPDYVYVRVQIGNNCGMGEMFSKRISTSQLPSSYTMSYNAASRLIEIKNEGGDADISENKAGRLNYQIINTRTGLICGQGSVPYTGGMIDINTLPAGLYTARLISPDGKTETLKIAL